MSTILTFAGTVLVAFLSLLGVILQIRSKERQDNILGKIEAFKAESAAEDKKILDTLADHKLKTLKRWLTNELTKIKNGQYIPNEEQRYMFHEAKRDYNALGGDSYVDDLFEEVRAKKLL